MIVGHQNIVESLLRPSKAYSPFCAWPAGAQVQWGESGLVVQKGAGQSFPAAYFEVRLGDGKTPIRADGETVSRAEALCYERYIAQMRCGQHDFQQAGHHNTAGVCRRCGLYQAGLFEPVSAVT